MVKLIQPNQVCFIARRHIANNILIAQEIIYALRTCKDNLVLFCKANLWHAEVVSDILGVFSKHSGHKVSSYQNSHFFSNNDVGCANVISKKFGFTQVEDLAASFWFTIEKDNREWNE
ncbi:hypothetical protein J1N35_002631 [Gossypium stocksii]|uniref:Uncharacterized protein n=1 Tax=Gossypium stocksii TaxID=47602 RepID=A0A9D4ANQ8_9ROSI|nr:hypothetical protein J1N35_002631 [Gossypium stocksii]